MWCALDDWHPDPMASAYCAFLPGSIFPLAWTSSGPRTVSAGSSIPKAWCEVALAAHWAQEHPDQLRAFVGEFEMAFGMVRPASKAAQA